MSKNAYFSLGVKFGMEEGTEVLPKNFQWPGAVIILTAVNKLLL